MDTVVFTAEQVGPPKRRFWIYGKPSPSTEGWTFVVDNEADGEWCPGFDSWERWFFEVLRYPPAHALADLVWHSESTGEAVDLAQYQIEADGIAARLTDTPSGLGLPA